MDEVVGRFAAGEGGLDLVAVEHVARLNIDLISPRPVGKFVRISCQAYNVVSLGKQTGN